MKVYQGIALLSAALLVACSGSSTSPSASTSSALSTATTPSTPTATTPTTGPTTTGPTAPPPPVGVEARLGISAKPPLGSDPDERRVRGDELDAIVDGGFRILRTDFLWHRIEPAQGVFEFGDYDRLVDDCTARGIEVVALLCYGNPWASATWGFTGDALYPPDDPADFAAFVAATVTQFAGRVRRYEIWNEPNGPFFWKPLPGGDPRAFGELLQAAYAAAKTADPAVEVCFGGTFYPGFAPLTPGTVDFVTDVFAQHPPAVSAFDAFAFHPYRYPFQAPEATPLAGVPGQEPLVEAIDNVRSLLSAHGSGSTPLWITEFGWHTAQYSLPFIGVDEIDQARFLVRATVLALSRGVDLTVWYELKDAGPDFSTWQEHAFGLLAYDADPLDPVPARRKPAFTAHKALAQTLQGTRFDADVAASLGLPAEARAFRFAAAGRELTVLWRTGGTSSVRIPLGAFTGARVISLDGTASSVTPSGQPPAIVVTLSEDPLYVELR